MNWHLVGVIALVAFRCQMHVFVSAVWGLDLLFRGYRPRYAAVVVAASNIAAVTPGWAGTILGIAVCIVYFFSRGPDEDDKRKRKLKAWLSSTMTKVQAASWARQTAEAT